MNMQQAQLKGQLEQSRWSLIFEKMCVLIVVESFSAKPCVGKGGKTVILGRTYQISSM